jgi:hypothetical protein
MLRGFTLLVVYLGSLFAILFVSFGSLDWPVGWAALGIYTAISLTNSFLVDPDLVRERSRLGEGVQRRDMLLAGISFLFLFPVTLAIAGIDAGRLGWSPPLTASVFINDDESGLHHDYEVWLERLAPHSPIDQADPEAGCTTAPVKTPVQDGQDRRRAPQAADHGPGGGGRGDQWTA